MKPKKATKIKAIILSIFVHSSIIVLIGLASLELVKKTKTEIEITTGGAPTISEPQAVQPAAAPQIATTLPEKKTDEVVQPKPVELKKPAAPKKPVAKVAKKAPVAKPAAKKEKPPMPAPTVAESSDDSIEVDEKDLPQAVAIPTERIVETDPEPVVEAEPVTKTEPIVEEPVEQAIAETLPEKKVDPQEVPVEKAIEETEAAAPQAALSDDEENWAKELQAATIPAAQASPSTGRTSGSGGRDTGFVRSESELTPQKGNPQAIYPPVARLRKVEGTAVVRFSVNEKGQVSQAWLQASSGSKAIDDEALKTQKSWKYQPGKIGIFQKSWVFRLTGEPEDMPYRIRR